MSGKVIKQITVSGPGTDINMVPLAQGIYLLKYIDPEPTQMIKISKQ